MSIPIHVTTWSDMFRTEKPRGNLQPAHLLFFGKESVLVKKDSHGYMHVCIHVIL